LSNALEDGRSTNQDILARRRSGGEHVRVVDLVLEKD
jgi:hypothetical protein